MLCREIENKGQRGWILKRLRPMEFRNPGNLPPRRFGIDYPAISSDFLILIPSFNFLHLFP